MADSDPDSEPKTESTRDLDDHRSPARVREVYDDIAAHFSKTRAYPWPETEEFIADVPSGGLALDIGCGNGRNLELLADHCDRAVGLDASHELLDEAGERLNLQSGSGAGTALIQADAASLPLASETVDVAVYVATLHHLPDGETRRESLDELARVLRPEGQALVSAWSTAHDRFEASADAEEGFDTTVDWTLPGGETVPRFYHIYAPAEFEADVAASALAVEGTTVSSGNCYARVRGERKRP